RSINLARQALASPHSFVEHVAVLIELEARQPRLALAIADQAIERLGATRALARARIRALSALGDWSAAVLASEQALESARSDTELWTLLARAEAALGNQAKAHLAMAEVHTMNGVWIAAIEQLQAAQRTRQLDFYASSKVDARLRELRATFLQEREDRRSGR
ncbi:MAG: M48 family peptidase, partial [Betaproteobacteria bacterium]